jgi:hypothetical protein
LHGKIDEMHAYTVSLEAKLKEPIPTSCSNSLVARFAEDMSREFEMSMMGE